MSEQVYIPIDQDTLDWLAELGEIAELHRTAPDELIWIWEHPAFRSPKPPKGEKTVTKLLTLQLEKSEKLQRLNTIQAKDEPTAEERQERDGLVQRLQEIEPELRAEMVLADGHQNQRTDSPTAEVRDYLGLVSRSRLHRFASAGLGDAQVDGAEAELRQADGLTDNKIPWGLLLPEGEPVLETRADATTGIPSNLPAVQQQILARVFAPGVSDFLGVRTVSVGTGQAVFPVLTTGSSVAQVARGAGKDATAGAFGSDVLKPRRLTAVSGWPSKTWPFFPAWKALCGPTCEPSW